VDTWEGLAGAAKPPACVVKSSAPKGNACVESPAGERERPKA